MKYPPLEGGRATIKFLQANSRAIDTLLGGVTLGHLGLSISDASYAQISPKMDAKSTLWVTPPAPGRAPATMDGTAAKISASRHMWEEDVQTYQTCTSIQQALQNHIISVSEPMNLDILMTTWWATPTSQQETCWTTYLKLKATSLQSTLR
jgi:hypothetical protein